MYPKLLTSSSFSNPKFSSSSSSSSSSLVVVEMSKSRIWSRILNHHSLLKQHSNNTPLSIIRYSKRNYCTNFFDLSPHARNAAAEQCLQELTYQAQKEREERIKAGLDTTELDNEEETDWMGVNPRVEKLMKQNAKSQQKNEDLNRYEESTDSDSDEDDLEDELKRIDRFEKKFDKHEKLLYKFTKAETLNDAYQYMKKIDELENKYFHPRLEYRVIGELMNRMKVAEGKEKFLLQVKLNRALRMVEMREAFDPNDPANYGIIQDEQAGGGDMDDEDKKELAKRAGGKDGDESDIDDMKEKDTALLKKLGELDKELEKKLAELDHTFGKKGKLLEEEIRDLAEERNALTEEKRQPLYRKGFDVKLIDVNRTCKVTKGGQVVKYTAMLACGNYHGTVGFAKAKGPAIPVALQKAHEKCFQNLHVIDRHEEHTIAHAIQTSYKKTKVYLWPAPTQTGMKAGRTVQIILQLAGFKNVKSKVVGSRNPHNTVKAVFKALNAIESPKDVADKFGRTVVESTLL